MKKELIICVGISGSGKSTWSINFIKENQNYLRINRDKIRENLIGDLNGYYQRKDLKIIEEQINFVELYLLGTIGDDNYNIIIDNTNLKRFYIKKYLEWIKHSNYTIKFKLFDISLEEAKERVYNRENMYQWGELLNKEEVLKYIDKQFEQYNNIKKYIEDNFKENII